MNNCLTNFKCFYFVVHLFGRIVEIITVGVGACADVVQNLCNQKMVMGYLSFLLSSTYLPYRTGTEVGNKVKMSSPGKEEEEKKHHMG